MQTALTIGNFDGVHIGHAALVAAARRAVGSTGRVVALSFDPHPASVLRPGTAPPRLSTLERKRAWLIEAGADEVRLLTPARELLEQSPEAFIAALVDQFRPVAVVEGPDFRFGSRRAGGIEALRAFGRAMEFEAIVVEGVEATLADQSRVVVSSTLVRWLVAQGRVGDAARCLGRPFELGGEVVRGEQRGRTIGYPTANLDHRDLLLPADGVYAGVGHLPDGSCRSAAISVGTKPMFSPISGLNERLCEVFIIDHDGALDEYGWPLRVTLDRWLREQMSFATLDGLLEQMRRDVARAAPLSVPGAAA